MSAKSPCHKTKAPRKGCLKKEASKGSLKKVCFDEIEIREYTNILGDNPAVSAGAPITIGWKSRNEQVLDLDFYEYCRGPKRARKKLILSVRRRANMLLAAGYTLEEIASATLSAEKTKKMRADSLKGSGWDAPWELLSGAVEATGRTLRRVDVLGVGVAAGAVVGGATAVGTTVGKGVYNGVNHSVRLSITGVNAVVGAGSSATVATGRALVAGLGTSSRAVTEAGKVVTKPIHKGVVKPVNKAVVKPVGKVVVGTVNTTGRAVSGVVNGIATVVGLGDKSNRQVDTSTKGGDGNSPTRPADGKKSVKRRVSLRGFSGKNSNPIDDSSDDPVVAAAAAAAEAAATSNAIDVQ